jgi:penicillin-binding protein 1C
MITDVAVNYQGYAPENYDKKFNGFTSMEYALEHSLNIPAVKSLRLLGKDKLVEKLAACNFQQVKKDQQKLGLSMILGGCGATLEELTGLYSAFANEGVYVQPSFTQADSLPKKTRILSTAANFMINETLSKVNRPDFPLNWQSTEHMPKIAWKTGTSYGRRDAWSIGYNKQFTIGVWTGNFSAQGIPELSGANIATPLLFKIFNTVDYDSDQDWFTQPKDCDIRRVCSETGLPPSDYCSNIVTDYFIPLVSTGSKCNNMEEIMVSANEKTAYCQSCVPATGYKKKWYKIISPDMQAWMSDNRVTYAQIPPHNPACEKVFKEGAPLIMSPSNGTEYLISRKHPEQLQLVGRAAADAGRLYWYINNRFYKSCSIGEKQFFVPEEGPVKISCTDDKGRNRDVWIKVRYVNL